MWRELIWNIEFLRGFIFLVIGIVAAILLVPRIVKRMQVEKDKRLAKELMRGWSHTCMFGITGLKPDQRGAQYPRFESSESANWDLKGYDRQSLMHLREGFIGIRRARIRNCRVRRSTHFTVVQVGLGRW
jgi:hypothetical protein